LENALVSDRNLFPKLPTSVYGNKKGEGYEEAMRTIPVESVINKVIPIRNIEKPNYFFVTSSLSTSLKTG
jgi:hypothetical protein